MVAAFKNTSFSPEAATKWCQNGRKVQILKHRSSNFNIGKKIHSLKKLWVTPFKNVFKTSVAEAQFQVKPKKCLKSCDEEAAGQTEGTAGAKRESFKGTQKF